MFRDIIKQARVNPTRHRTRLFNHPLETIEIPEYFFQIPEIVLGNNMALQHENFRDKDFNLVPVFDGQTANLPRFLRILDVLATKYQVTQFENHRVQFLMCVESKLIGNVANKINAGQYNTWTAMRKALTESYEDRRSVETLTYELTHTYQREEPLDFFDKIMLKYNDIQAKISLNNQDEDQEKEAKIDFLTKLTIFTVKNNMREPLKQELFMRNPQSLVEIQGILGEYKQRQQSLRNFTPPGTPRNNSNIPPKNNNNQMNQQHVRNQQNRNNQFQHKNNNYNSNNYAQNQRNTANPQNQPRSNFNPNNRGPEPMSVQSRLNALDTCEQTGITENYQEEQNNTDLDYTEGPSDTQTENDFLDFEASVNLNFLH